MPRNRSVFTKILLLSISVLAVASCSSESPKQAKTNAPIPPVTGHQGSTVVLAEAPQPLASSDTLTPILPVAPAAEEPVPLAVQTTDMVEPRSSAVAALPPSGVAGIEARIARLEQAVGSLRADYDRMMPAFASLNTTNERIQSLLDELEHDAGRHPAVATTVAAPAAPLPVAEPPAPVAAASAPVAAPAPAPVLAPKTAKTVAGASAVSGLRIGEHGAKTRLVLDLTGASKPEFKYDLDNAEKLLLVDLPSTGWAGALSGRGGASAFVDGWSVQPAGNGRGSSLAIQLKKSARVLAPQFLPPAGGSPARLVLDIASGN